MKRVFRVLPSGLIVAATDAAGLLGVMEAFRVVVPTAKLSFVRLSDAGVEPKVFRYKIEADNGRIWKQTITFDNLQDPQMTFEVADQWRLSEFSNQRNVRNVLVGYVAKYPTLESLVYDYTEET